MKKRSYITTPLYYVNDKPHIGHAYTNILCDAFARFDRFLGEDVFFMTGTDEHGTKIEKTAREKGVEPQEYVDSIMPHFEGLWKQLGISHDYFFRTTFEYHKKTVQEILIKLEASGEIYRAKYTGWYSIKSETFYNEKELVDGRCPDTGGEVQRIEEENFFFRLSKYQDWLLKEIRTNKDWIQPEIRRNEILGFLDQPLEDLCITRPKERLQWGIPYPGVEDYVVYVWFDALINYISGAGYLQDDAKYASLWPADLHVVGKDILRHHAVYWPIMLKALDLPMPKVILAHGWWTLAGAKVSKSTGNIVNPIELIDKYGVDALRYFLLNEVTVGFDGAYSEDLLRERYRTDLANDLGNLWHRTLSMLQKYFDGIIPEEGSSFREEVLYTEVINLYAPVEAAMNEFNPRSALKDIWQVIRKANQYIEENKPWVLAKDPESRDRLACVLRTLLEVLAHEALILKAFLPQTASEMASRMQLVSGQSATVHPDQYKESLLVPGLVPEKGKPLFPRLEDDV